MRSIIRAFLILTLVPTLASSFVPTKASPRAGTGDSQAWVDHILGGKRFVKKMIA